MVRIRLTLTLAALAAAAAFNLAGCPGAASLTPADIPSEDVLAVLGETLSADEIEDAQFSGESRSVIVGEATAAETSAVASIDDVAFEDIDVDPTDVFDDVLVDDGGLVRAHGGLAGRFINDRPDGTSDEVGGVFRGRWFSAEGEVRGIVRGEFRPLPPGKLPPGLAGGGVFNGRYIDSDGQFRGFLRGRYGHRAAGRGFFFGRWLDRYNRLVGIVEGHWDEEENAGGGVFRGRWASFNICDEAASMPDSEIELMSPVDVDAIDALALTDVAVAQARSLDLSQANDVEVADEPDVAFDEQGPPCIDPDAPYGFLRGWYRAVRPQIPGDPNDPDDPNDPNDPNAPEPRHGLMHGHWLSMNAAIGGRLLGRWAAVDGDPGEGPRVLGHFHARYVSRSGEIRGSIHGAYGVSEHGLGVFRGRYFDVEGTPLGVLAGRWASAPNTPGGPFFGMWAGVDFGDEE